MVRSATTQVPRMERRFPLVFLLETELSHFQGIKHDPLLRTAHTCISMAKHAENVSLHLNWVQGQQRTWRSISRVYLASAQDSSFHNLPDRNSEDVSCRIRVRMRFKVEN